MLDLLRRETDAEVPAVWHRMVGPITRGELGRQTLVPAAYECVRYGTSAAALFDAILVGTFTDALLSDLLSAVLVCVQNGGPILRENLERVDAICRRFDGEDFVRKIRAELG